MHLRKLKEEWKNDYCKEVLKESNKMGDLINKQKDMV